jgi:hypothetical protein
MTVRFSVSQGAVALGLGVGGVVTSALGPRHAFTVFGLGLLVVAVGYTAYLLLCGGEEGAYTRDPML